MYLYGKIILYHLRKQEDQRTAIEYMHYNTNREKQWGNMFSSGALEVTVKVSDITPWIFTYHFIQRINELNHDNTGSPNPYSSNVLSGYPCLVPCLIYQNLYVLRQIDNKLRKHQRRSQRIQHCTLLLNDECGNHVAPL